MVKFTHPLTKNPVKSLHISQLRSTPIRVGYLDKNRVPVMPQTAAKIRVHMGVPIPNPKPKKPPSIRIGKTMRALDNQGSMLRAAPFFIGAFL